LKPVYICPHIVDETTAYVGIPTISNDPAFLCPDCGAERIAELAETMQPADIFRLLFVEKQHAPEITKAIQRFTIVLKQSDPSNTLTKNRAQTVARYICNAHGLGTSKQERFVRLRYGQDDGIPSYKRKLEHYRRAQEPKSLSSFSGVEAYNRREETA
jgi:hypothetical protein